MKTKTAINKLVSGKPYAVVVASCGRSGSTMLTNALARSALSPPFKTLDSYLSGLISEKAVIDYAWRLGDTSLQPGFVYKTHDYPPKKIERNERYIYTYSRPSKVIPSTIKKAEREGWEWLRQHAYHLRGSANSRNEIISKDSLNIIENISSWVSSESKKILCIKYDNIWDKESEIAEFSGIDLKLPKRKSRTSSLQKLDEREKMCIKKLDERYSKVVR